MPKSTKPAPSREKLSLLPRGGPEGIIYWIAYLGVIAGIVFLVDWIAA